MLSLILVFFYLFFVAVFGAHAMPTGSHHFKRHEHLLTRVHNLRLSRYTSMNVNADGPLQSPRSWSENRLEEGLVH
ncbi:hypothetical protein CCMA1212_003541 [Trichoderma ghanense]|uniref:Secreted protein n=1 Tax=Trichoderma ghanense TaxID=65468 RepID=A0ABY2H728_9HYPO